MNKNRIKIGIVCILFGGILPFLNTLHLKEGYRIYIPILGLFIFMLGIYLIKKEYEKI